MSNILWIGYGPLRSTYNHSGRPTKDILKHLSEYENKIIFTEGVVRDFENYYLFDENTNVHVIVGKNILEYSKKDRFFGRKKMINDTSRSIVSAVNLFFKSKVDIIVVDTQFWTKLALKFGYFYNCPIEYRVYGVWNKPERLMIRNIENNTKGLWRFIRTKLNYQKLSTFVNSNYVKKIVATHDGSNGSKYFNKIKNVKKRKVEVKFLRNNHSVGVEKLANFGFSIDNMNLIYISRMEPSKKPDIPIRVMNRIKTEFPHIYKRIKLNVIGTGSCLDKIKLLADNLGVSENINFFGYVERSQICYLIPNIALSICVNTYNPVLESISSGIPAIINDWGIVEDLYKGVTGVTVIGGDLKKLLLNKNEEEKLIKCFCLAIVNYYNSFSKLDSSEKSDFSSKIKKSVMAVFPNKSEKIKMECREIETCSKEII